MVHTCSVQLFIEAQPLVIPVVLPIEILFVFVCACVYFSQRVQDLGFGLQIHSNAVNSSRIQSGLKQLLQEHTNFAAQARRIGRFNRGGSQRAADIIEELVETEYAHLFPAYFTLPFYKKFNLDIYLCVAIVCVVVVMILRWILCCGVRMCCGDKTKHRSKQHKE